jgi:hypothetical protein
MNKTQYSEGDVFNFWELIKYVKEERRWLARCICGEEKLVWINHLVTEKSTSCSCKTKHTHGMSRTPIYKIWDGVKGRCTNSNNKRYKDYGGRGISICDRWLIFENFYADMGERPEGLSIDRIDVNGNYEPNNCRWATDRVQYDNTQFSTKLGIDCSLRELAKKHNIPYSTIQSRIFRGWSVEDALNTPDIKDNMDILFKSNRSGIRGICWDCKTDKWMVKVQFENKSHWLGRFESLDEAEATIKEARYKIKNKIPL